MKLLVVEDTFQVRGRGLILAPDVELSGGARTLAVELRRSDGTVVWTEAQALVPMIGTRITTTPLPRGHVLIVQLEKSEVPVGTEVWTDDRKR